MFKNFREERRAEWRAAAARVRELALQPVSLARTAELRAISGRFLDLNVSPEYLERVALDAERGALAAGSGVAA